MEGSGRSRAVLWIVALVAVLAVFQSCAPGEEQGPPIPPPPFAFGDSATVRQYLDYAVTLGFATGDSTSAITRHPSGADTSVVRMSPENRLVSTPDSAYMVGRIIARVETSGAISPYGTPVGQAFVWVWQAPDAVRARIITDEPGLPAGGRVIDVPTFYHIVLPDTVRRNTFCVSLDEILPGDCCRCGSGCWNIWAAPASRDAVEALVRGIIGG